jgi:CheY-like chemotaxis protein
MGKLMVVDDDEALRRLVRLNLGDTYEIVDTGEPEQALALALEHQPDAILLDLRMPKVSGLQLCHTLSSFCSTQMIPFFVVSGAGGATTKDSCMALGASGYFEKPVDFDALKATLAQVVKPRPVIRRTEVRVNLRVPLKLRGLDAAGKPFESETTTENASISGFLCVATIPLAVGSAVDVYLMTGKEEFVGKARIVNLQEGHDAAGARYGCRFIEKTGVWVLQ